MSGEWNHPGAPFSADELAPLVGRPTPDRSDAAIERVAAALAAYDRIRVDTDRHRMVSAHFAEVMALGRAKGAAPFLGGRVLGPSGSGKSTAAARYAAAYEARGFHAPTERPVLIVAIDRAATSRRLFSSILQALGDGFYERGTEEVLQKRAHEGMTRFGVRLLVVDEVQHLRFRSTARNDTTDTLKRMLDAGPCPIMFCGTDEATEFLNANVQLSNRLLPPCDLPPLRRGEAADRRVFKDYVRQIDEALLRTELTRASSELTEKRRLSCLMEVSGGVLGQASNLLRAALASASGRMAGRIEVHDLSAATVGWAVAQGVASYDPFRLGVRRPSRG